MAAKTSKKTPLSFLRPQSEYPVDWECVDAAEATTAPRAKDLLGLTPEDRAALGLTPAAPPAPSASDEDAGRVLSRVLR